jgi:uncharacterized damage-inducible protein DinB
MTGGITFEELLAYNDEENRRWKDFFSRHPEALELPLDIAGTVRDLVLHIFSVELFFANSIGAGGRVDVDTLFRDSLDAIFGLSSLAAKRFREFIAQATPADWEEKVELGGALQVSASRRKMLAQALTHSMRHWAQIATFLRQNGYKQERQHDFLLSKAMD